MGVNTRDYQVFKGRVPRGPSRSNSAKVGGGPVKVNLQDVEEIGRAGFDLRKRRDIWKRKGRTSTNFSLVEGAS